MSLLEFTLTFLETKSEPSEECKQSLKLKMWNAQESSTVVLQIAQSLYKKAIQSKSSWMGNQSYYVNLAFYHHWMTFSTTMMESVKLDVERSISMIKKVPDFNDVWLAHMYLMEIKEEMTSEDMVMAVLGNDDTLDSKTHKLSEMISWVYKLIVEHVPPRSIYDGPMPSTEDYTPFHEKLNNQHINRTMWR